MMMMLVDFFCLIAAASCDCCDDSRFLLSSDDFLSRASPPYIAVDRTCEEAPVLRTPPSKDGQSSPQLVLSTYF